MELVKRYLYREFWNFFILTLAIFIFIFMLRPLLWLMDLIINHFFTTVSTIKFFLYSLFEVSPDIISLSFFTALSGTIARMNMEREYWVFLISGISANRIVKNFVIFAIVFTIIEFWLCFFVSPSAMYKRKLLLNQAQLDEPMKFFRSKSIITDFPGLSIYIKKIQQKDFCDIILSYKQASELVCIVNAKRARLMFDNRGYLFLFLQNGFFEIHSLKTQQTILKTFFDFYSFPLPFQKTVQNLPQRKLKEMNLLMLLDTMRTDKEKSETILVILKKLFFTILPLFYLILGFFTGIGIRAKSNLQILATGLFIGISSYLIILFGEGLVYWTKNSYSFLMVPLIFICLTIIVRRKFSHVT